MPNVLIHFWSKQSKAAIACLSLVPLLMSCGAADVAEPPSNTTTSTPEAAIVAEEPSDPSLSEPQASSPQPATGGDNQLIDLESGMSYADARARLLEKGWVPAEGPEPGPYGVERKAYDAGFTEVAACAGTGAGQCRFDFFHPGEQKALSVITYGGAQLEVGDWNVQSIPPGVAAAPADSSQVQSVIPMQFQGEWTAGVDLAGCGTPGSDGRLQIGLDRVDFYESSGNVQEVVTQGELKVTVTAEYSSEGSTFTEAKSFELSSDRATLTRIDEDGFSNQYRRCPS
jgi:hypothetical protein